MITLTKLNEQEFILNSDLIEIIEETPNTVITLTTGNKYVVQEANEEIIEKIMQYKRQILHGTEGWRGI